ncbi:MAG: RNA polymerase sigma factor [Burkholderiaceae bacterium]|jgi:RNA polymerase sigma-70 factor (ECF subfamily)|nr:RNA polymerase sigma factor [Burkholderiaceae bacterium]
MDREELLSRFPAHRGKLVAVLVRLVGATEAEDLANETLLRAMAAVEGFRGEAGLGTWLHRITVNLAYDHLRRYGRDPAIPNGVGADLPDIADDSSPDVLEQRQMSACVQKVLATLPASQRQLLIQADVLDQTTAEIARDAGITTGNAKIRLHRARRNLEVALESRCEFHHRDGGVLCCTPKSKTA